MYENQSQALADLGASREYFQRLRVHLRDAVFASGNYDELDIIEAALRRHESGFLTHMAAYRPTIYEPENIELYNEIMEVFADFQPRMQQIMASARVYAPPVQMVLMMDNLINPTDFIADALYYLAYIRVQQAAHVNALNQTKILLVEDNEKLNDGNRRALEGEGYTVFCALTLEMARVHLRQNEPDIILFDVDMPDGDGFSFCKEIRGQTKAHIIFLTARREHSELVQGLGLGGDDYIKEALYVRRAFGARGGGKCRANPPNLW